MKHLLHRLRSRFSEPVSHHQHWETVYLSKAPTEVSWFQERPGQSLDFIAASGVGKEGRIIDVGGGSSNLVDHLWQDGYRHISVLDVSGPALDHARLRLGPVAGHIDWIVGDITEWQPEKCYDLWHDRAVFHFLTDGTHRAAYRMALNRALVPGGHLVIATFASDGPKRCSGLAVRRYSPETMADEMGAGFQFIDTAEEEHATPSGHRQKFVYCRFRRVRVS